MKIFEILGFFGLIFGFLAVSIAIFTATIFYFKNPKLAGALGSFSNLCMISGFIFYNIYKEGGFYGA